MLLTLDEEEVLDVEVDELLAILFCDKDLITILLKVLSNLISQELVIDGEGSCQDVFKWCLFFIVQDILETGEDVWLPQSKVLDIKGLIKKNLVAGG